MTLRLCILLAAAAAFLTTAATCPAEELGRVTDFAGNPPGTIMVEQPYDAVKLWHAQGQKGRTLVLISEDLPLYPLDDTTTGTVLKDISSGRWDDILEKDYETTRYYPVNRSSYLYTAYRAGMISRIYWVPPTKKSVADEPIDSIRGRFAAMSGEEGTENLHKTGPSVTGTVNGIPVYICSLRDLPDIDGEVILAVDLTFFTVLYKGEIKTPFLDLFASFMKTLSESGLKASDAVISFSTSLGVVPLQQRFIGDYLREFLTQPDSLSNGPPDAWRLRAQAMHYETFFQVDETLDAYRKAVDETPKDASLRFALALSYLAAKNAARMKKELDIAVSLDKGYYPAYSTYGKYLCDKGLTLDAEDFVNAAVKINPEDPEAWKAKHYVMRAAGNHEEALAAQKKLVALGYDGPEPLYQLAQDYASLGRYNEAKENYQRSLGMLPMPDTSQRPMVLLGLANTYEKTGRIQEALDTYRSAMDVTADKHAKSKIYEKYDSLKKKWAPFMKGRDGQNPGVE